jgi:hypothetical protein
MRIAKEIHTNMVVQVKAEGTEYPIGTVDGIKRGRYIKLRRSDTGNPRDYIPLEWVESVSDNTVRLSKRFAAAQHEWLFDGETKRHKHFVDSRFED